MTRDVENCVAGISLLCLASEKRGSGVWRTVD
jgi:hypothetical protein